MFCIAIATLIWVSYETLDANSFPVYLVHVVLSILNHSFRKAFDVLLEAK